MINLLAPVLNGLGHPAYVHMASRYRATTERKEGQCQPATKRRFADVVAKSANEWLGLRFGLHSSADLSLRLSASVVTPYIAAIGRGSSYAYWRFEKHDVPLHGRDLEAWSILAVPRWQEQLEFKARFYFEARIFLISRRVESDWVDITCPLH